jgi:hypothetical protein
MAIENNVSEKANKDDLFTIGQRLQKLENAILFLMDGKEDISEKTDRGFYSQDDAYVLVSSKTKPTLGDLVVVRFKVPDLDFVDFELAYYCGEKFLLKPNMADITLLVHSWAPMP